jgi:hypothetical protein
VVVVVVVDHKLPSVMIIIKDTKAQQLTMIDLALTSSHTLFYPKDLALIQAHPFMFLNPPKLQKLNYK